MDYQTINTAIFLKTFYALRKSLNSNVLIPLGIDVTDRAAMLGHSVETNLRHYSYAKKDNTDALIALLNDSDNECGENLILFSKSRKKNCKSAF